MKQFLFLFVLLPAVAGSLMAQDSTTEKPDILNARIMTRQGRLTNGYLYSIADTTLLLSWEKRLPRMYDTTTTHGVRSFGYRDLEYVTIYRRGSTGRCICSGRFVRNVPRFSAETGSHSALTRPRGSG